MTVSKFIEDIKQIRLSNVFNPYSDFCSERDVVDAPELRSEILTAILTCAEQKVLEAIWIGRDLGHLGGARTGLAFTDGSNFNKHLSRWGVSFRQPTLESQKERTATMIWRMLDQIKDPVFLWNAFPFHPYNPGNMNSNRAHSKRERRIGEDILVNLIDLIRPARIVAVGNDAELVALRSLPKNRVLKVRHPSYGGQSIFYTQIKELYNLVPVREIE